MVAELTTPTYFFHNGKFQIESKDQVKKRLGRSPDNGDALCLTFSLPDQPAQSVEFVLPRRARSTLDYDPVAQMGKDWDERRF